MTSTVAKSGAETSNQKLVPVTKTVGDMYNEDIADNGPFIKPPEGADAELVQKHREADFRRWMSIRMARSMGNDNGDYFEKLLLANTIEKLNRAQSSDPKIKGIDDLMKNEGTRRTIEMIESSQAGVQEEFESRIAKFQAAGGTVSERVDVPRRPMTLAEVTKLTKKYNVLVRQALHEINEGDEKYKLLRQNADAARKFVELGMQRPEYNEGIDENTDAETREKFERDALVAADAILKFEEWRDPRTRPDGACYRQVSVDIKEFSDRMVRESQGLLKPIKDFFMLDDYVIQTRIEQTRETLFAALLFTEIVEVPVFTSRLMNIVCGQPLARVIRFTDAYKVYTASIHVLLHSDVAPEHDEIVQQRAKKMRTMKRAGVKVLKPKSKQNVDKYSKRECLRALQEQRLESRRRFVQEVKALIDWFTDLDRAAEDAAYWESMPDQERPDVAVGAATRWEIVFYQRLLECIRAHCVDILVAQEGCILLLLQDYIPKKELYYLSTPLKEPPESLMHPDFPALIREGNEGFGAKRRQFYETQRAAGKVRELGFADIPEDGLSVPVKSGASWAPTFGQLQGFLKFFGSVLSVDQSDLKQHLKEFEKHMRDKELQQKRENEIFEKKKSQISQGPGMVMSSRTGV